MQSLFFARALRSSENVQLFGNCSHDRFQFMLYSGQNRGLYPAPAEVEREIEEMSQRRQKCIGASMFRTARAMPALTYCLQSVRPSIGFAFPSTSPSASR